MAGLAPNSPLFSQELDEWVDDSMLHVSHADKLTLFKYRTADVLENKMVTLSVTLYASGYGNTSLKVLKDSNITLDLKDTLDQIGYYSYYL